MFYLDWLKARYDSALLTYLKNMALVLPVGIALSVWLFFGCTDTSVLAVGHMDLVAPPDKLVYVLGKDDSLDLTGASVQCFNFEGSSMGSPSPLSNYPEHIFSSVDFTKEGIYLVTVGGYRLHGKHRGQLETVFFQFNVEVAAHEPISSHE